LSQYRLVDGALAHLGLRDFFALVHSDEDEDGDYGKPHPAMFLTAAAKPVEASNVSASPWHGPASTTTFSPSPGTADGGPAEGCAAAPREGGWVRRLGASPSVLLWKSSGSACSHDQRRRTFIAFFLETLAIWKPICFYDDSKASTEEVHMKIHWTNRQMSKVCADAAEDHRALLG
jgi:hypothetical protein